MRIPSPRRLAAVTTALAMAAALNVGLLAPAASADDAGTLTVVGTSDVFDSNLVQTVLEPGFEAAYPQYNLNYVSKGTGAAIAYAEAGSASAMIVHAAALENQFVADGYSAEPYGRAIFWGDYVLAGPASDPAGVLTGDSATNITHAFEKVAAAGAEGDATFVSRGGTPGTTVQEHAIWAGTTGVTTCDVSGANGGGTSPSTTTGSCSSPIAYPSWYKATGLTQGPNIINASACNYADPHQDNCYVFTDRGTFQYLVSTGAVTNLELMTRADPAGDPAIANLLVNSFHAYALNPDKFTDTPAVEINSAAATAFLDWITSPAAQQAVGDFLAEDDDPPFIPSAAPDLDVTSVLPATLPGGRSITVRGTLTNVVPGTPALDGVPVKLLARPKSAPGAAPTVVAQGLTTSTGSFAISYTPKASQAYSVAVDDITKIQIDTLDPVFGDILEGTSADAGATVVVGGVKVGKVKVTGKRVRLRGDLLPRAIGSKATVSLYAAHPGRSLKKIGSRKVADGAKRFDVTFRLGKGTWKVQLRYTNDPVIKAGSSATKRVRVR